MSSPSGYESAFDGPAVYQITIQGKIAPGRSDRLKGMASRHATLEDGTPCTTLTGKLADQAALTGMLNTIYELRLSLVAVKRLLSDSMQHQEGQPSDTDAIDNPEA